METFRQNALYELGVLYMDGEAKTFLHAQNSDVIQPQSYHMQMWIPAERQLPPLDTKVLAYLDGEYYVCELSEGHEKDDPFLWHDEDYDLLARQLTPDDHWMYLPEPPRDAAD